MTIPIHRKRKHRDMAEINVPTDDREDRAVKMIPRIDKPEFKEALEVFGKKSPNTVITKEDLPQFLRSIGLNEYRDVIEAEVRAQNYSELNATTLEKAINDALEKEIPNYDSADRDWPSDEDVLKAFSVFDQDGNGSIPVQQLKRFLLQAQLDIPEEELEKLIRELCNIDNDDQINYEEFVRKLSYKVTIQ